MNTLQLRKKAQPLAKVYFSDQEKTTIIATVAKDLDEGQRNVFFYTCQALGLNPLLNEVCAVVYNDRESGGKTMSIQVMRDGFLSIAHRSGKFTGLESGVKTDEHGKVLCGWAKVYHKDYTVPVYQEADFEEYNTGKRLWSSKPKTMIKKVAESMALRKAFNVNGVYAPEEMEKEIAVASEGKKAPELPDGNDPATPEQIETVKKLAKNHNEGDVFDKADTMTKQDAANAIKELSKLK